MWYSFSNVCQEFLWPLNAALIGLAASFLLASRNKPRLAAYCSLAALLMLGTMSLPAFSNLLLEPLESSAGPRAACDYPAADAIVVLGGTVQGKTEAAPAAEEISGSRLLTAARLFRCRKAPVLLVSSGITYTVHESNRTEADDMADILIEMGVPQPAIVKESMSRTTEENASYSARLAEKHGWHSILLVTSAYHMRRANYWFLQSGFNTIPAPTRGLARSASGIRAFMPSARALELSTKAVKEYAGVLAARLKSKSSLRAH